MCYIALAALALTAAGTYATYQGQQQAKDAENDAVNAAAKKQQGLDAQNTSIVQQSIQHASQPNQADIMAEAARNRAATYQQASQAAMGGLQLPSGISPDSNETPGNRVVNDAYNKQALKIGDFLTQQGNAKSNLDAFGDTQLGNALFNQNQGYRTQLFSNFMGGNQNVLPYQLGAASFSGDNAKTIGAGLTTLGSIAGTKAAQGSAPSVPKTTARASKKPTSNGIGSFLSASAIGQPNGYQV